MEDITAVPAVARLLEAASGGTAAGGDPRLKAILADVLRDSYRTIARHNVTPAEFWRAVHFAIGGAQEFPLWFPALGFETLLDLLGDQSDAARGEAQGTPRTIEGPLYVAGAPLSKGEATLYVTDQAGPRLTVSGRVVSLDGTPIGNALLDVWQADLNGAYSHFDPSQPAFNFRRRVQTRADGSYTLHTIEPCGYGAPPGGTTEALMAKLGRHANRPAHIHFFVAAEGHRHLTTQINIADDPLLNDDFALATRDGLSPPISREGDTATITFNFVLVPTSDDARTKLYDRPRAAA
jgi:catechol 1,2-dioxygenase